MKRVLVVEDNDNNMVLITAILEKSGYTTIRATNGGNGISLAQKEIPDFILLDIQLPDMDGLEVLREIRHSNKTKDIPVITITSYAMEGDRDRLINAGCNGYIEKPIDPKKIIGQIMEITGN